MNQIVEVKVPDLGDFAEVPVIELLVKAGDTIQVDDAIVTLESDKATMDVPSPVAGTVREVLVQVGSKVSEGALLIKVEAGEVTSPPADITAHDVQPTGSLPPLPQPLSHAGRGEHGSGGREDISQAELTSAGIPPHASPSVRAFARELGVDLAKVPATGPKNRILKEDVSRHVKGVMNGAAATPAAVATGGGGAFDLLPWPKVDFSKFGAVEIEPLSRIKKISGQNLSRNWVMIPAVTYHEDADITDLEAFRLLINKENEKNGAKLTLLAFLIKVAVKALQKFPEFNASLDSEAGEMRLVLKKYFNIGFAADTPHGLVVPVIKNADGKSLFDIAAEAGELARQARDGKLKPADMQGACFTISSLGGIGGTGFAPIVNAPEVAILGVNKAAIKPVWDGQQFAPRLMLPLSLTADHRVIDGALATRFNVYLAQLLADFRRVAL